MKESQQDGKDGSCGEAGVPVWWAANRRLKVGACDSVLNFSEHIDGIGILSKWKLGCCRSRVVCIPSEVLNVSGPKDHFWSLIRTL